MKLAVKMQNKKTFPWTGSGSTDAEKGLKKRKKTVFYSLFSF